MIDGDYYIEGGYLDNTPLASIFQDPEVEEIIACDFTDYDYHAELDKIYRSTHLHAAVQQHRYASVGQRHSADAAEQAHLCAGAGDQPDAGGDAQGVGGGRRPHLLPQADPRAAAEEPGEHDDLVEGRDRAEALLRARPRRRREDVQREVGISGRAGERTAQGRMVVCCVRRPIRADAIVVA